MIQLVVEGFGYIWGQASTSTKSAPSVYTVLLRVYNGWVVTIGLQISHCMGSEHSTTATLCGGLTGSRPCPLHFQSLFVTGVCSAGVVLAFFSNQQTFDSVSDANTTINSVVDNGLDYIEDTITVRWTVLVCCVCVM